MSPSFYQYAHIFSCMILLLLIVALGGLSPHLLFYLTLIPMPLAILHIFKQKKEINNLYKILLILSTIYLILACSVLILTTNYELVGCGNYVFGILIVFLISTYKEKNSFRHTFNLKKLSGEFSGQLFFCMLLINSCSLSRLISVFFLHLQR